MSAKLSAVMLMSAARRSCEAIALGPFTPVVFKHYEFIGGERGILLGHPVEGNEGRSNIAWDFPTCEKTA